MNRGNLIFPHLYAFIFLISFSCSISLPRNLNRILRRSRGSEHSPDLSGIASSSSHFRLMLAMNFTYIDFIVFGYVPSSLTFTQIFSVKGCWIFVKDFFFLVYRDDHLIFVFKSFYVVYHFC